jgi:NADH-quinone oxidoreductase subunit M
MFFLITISSIAVPGTNGFIGEFLILLGTFQMNKVAAGIAVTGVVWGAVYMLWLYKRVFFGKAGELVPEVADESHGHGNGHGQVAHHHASDEKHAHPLFDLSVRELCVMVPLIIFVFWMGLFPNQFLNKTKASLDYFVENRTHYQLTVKDTASTSSLAQTAVRGK